MKILFVTPSLPSPFGGGQRMFYMIKHLSQLGLEIHLLSLADGDSALEDIRVWCKKVHLVKQVEKLGDHLKNFFLLRAYTYFADFRSELQKLDLSRYDLIHVHKFQMAEYFKDIKHRPVIIDLWACGLSGSWYEFLYEKNLIEKLIKLARIPRFYLADLRYYKSFTYFFVVSPEAREYVQKRHPEKKVYLVPNGIESERFAALGNDAQEESHNLIFTGDMSFFQNVDTVIYFAKKIYPLIKARIKDAKFYIAGKEPTKEVRKLAQKDSSIIVTGFVEDITSYLQKASVFVAPLRTGSGTRNKILEAMAWGLPVVTTERAKEGIEAEDGQSFFLAKKSLDFANRVIDLLKDPQKRKEIGQRARRLVHEKYRWENIARDIALFYEDIIDDFRPK